MSCVVQSTGHMQCKPYDSVLALSSDLQAARTLTVIAIALGGIGLVLAFIGGKCTHFLDEKGAVKCKVAIVAGATLIAGGLFCLIPISWVAGALVRNFYSATSNAQQREIGACLYIGWGASILLVLGGGMLINSSCSGKVHETAKSPSVRYRVVRSSNPSSYNGSHRRQMSLAETLPVGIDYPRLQSFEAVTAKPQQYTNPLSWENASQQGFRQGSERSRAPSTKSQMKRAESTRSKYSDAPSTKSQLQKAEMEEVLSLYSDNDNASLNPGTTYL